MNTGSLITRRMILRDGGKAGLAMMVLGVAACAPESSDASTTTSGAASPGTSAPRDSTTSSIDTATSTPPSNMGWVRAELGGVSAYIRYRNGEAAVIDTGGSGSEGAIGEAMATVGLDWGSVGHIIVTHRHADHQGSLEAGLSLTSGSPWYAGAGDMSAVRASTEGIAVGDDDSVFDLRIIETPGHTAGHISVLDAAAGVLVSGDALIGANGGVTGASEQFSENMTLANASIRKLAEFDYEVALFGHGDPVESEADLAVRELAADL